ncbi:MAG: hypothetical protein R3C32_08070 [Chloroflexota bacterium]
MTDATIDASADAKVHVGWDELDALVRELAASIGDGYDVMLVITRGGMVPAGMCWPTSWASGPSRGTRGRA